MSRDRLRLSSFLLALVLVGTVRADVSMSGPSALREKPPKPPAGYQSLDQIKIAFFTGQLKTVDVTLAVPETVELTSDVVFGKGGGRDLKLDVYRPKKLERKAPTLIFIHGGAWKKGKKEDYRYYCIRYAEKGYVCASISYRFSKEAAFPAAVQDVKCAVRFLRANAAKYWIDPERMAAIGGSAGGHLALMLGYSAGVTALEGDGGHAGVSSKVHAVVDLYGPVDLTTDFATSSSSVTDFLGERRFEEAKDAYRLASPITHVSPDDPPTLILHGTIDDIVPIAQSDLLARELRKAEVLFIYDRLEGWPHTMDLAAPVNERCQWFMDRFFARYLAAGGDR